MQSISKLLEAVKWEAVSDAPYKEATHKGVVNIMGRDFRVYKMDDGSIVFNVPDIIAWLRKR